MCAEKSAAVSVSVVKSRRAVATARCPATNSTRHPWRTFSTFLSKMLAICPVCETCVPPQAREVEVANVDQAQFVALGGRKFAQAELPCFVAGHEADVDRAVLQDDLVGQALGGFDLLFRQRGRVEINRAVVVGHVERDRGHVVEADEGGGEHMLSGMLLHVVAAAGGVDLAADVGSGLQFFFCESCSGASR